MRLILSTFATAVLLLAACGGDSGSNSTTGSTAAPSPTEWSATATSAEPSSSTATSAAPAASNPTSQPPASTDGSSDSMAIAQGALLVRNDFPPDWTSEPQDPDDDAFADDDIFTGECAAYNTESFPGDLADAESDDFKGPEHQTVSSDASVFDSDASATSALEMTSNMPDTCMYQFEQGLTRIFKESFAEGGIDPSAEVVVTVHSMPWPQVGDGAAAYRIIWVLSTEGRVIGGTIDTITWRQGRMLTGITYRSYVAPDFSAQVSRTSQVAADESRLVDLLEYRAVHALNAAR